MITLQDQLFYSTRDNIWNNPHRMASKKIRVYYHEPEMIFKSKGRGFIFIENHFSD